MSLTALPGRGRPALVLAVVAVLALVGACGGGSDPMTPSQGGLPAATVIASPDLQPGDEVPAPADAAVLTLTGKISATNVERSLRLDPAALDRLGLLEMTVYEPWVKQTLEFQGVWLADLLKVAQTDGTAQSLHVTALDDYQIDLSMADVQAGGIFLATRTGDGSPIPIEDGGPTRIVFSSGVPSGSSPDQWIWSLTTIDVR